MLWSAQNILLIIMMELHIICFVDVTKCQKEAKNADAVVTLMNFKNWESTVEWNMYVLWYIKKDIWKLQSLFLTPSEKVFTALVVRRIKNISECTKLQNIVSKQNFSSIFRRRVEVQLKDKIRFSQAEVTKRLPLLFASVFPVFTVYKAMK